jgi:hypothetical protein
LPHQLGPLIRTGRLAAPETSAARHAAPGSNFLPGVFRSFSGFSAAADEAAMSRVYGGIHFRFARDDADIGAWTFAYFLHPTGNRSRK